MYLSKYVYVQLILHPVYQSHTNTLSCQALGSIGNYFLNCFYLLLETQTSKLCCEMHASNGVVFSELLTLYYAAGQFDPFLLLSCLKYWLPSFSSLKSFDFCLLRVTTLGQVNCGHADVLWNVQFSQF